MFFLYSPFSLAVQERYINRDESCKSENPSYNSSNRDSASSAVGVLSEFGILVCVCESVRVGFPVLFFWIRGARDGRYIVGSSQGRSS